MACRLPGVVALLLLGLSLNAGACAKGVDGELAWRVGFACPDDGLRAESVSLSISAGECPGGSSPVYQATIVRGESGTAVSPGELGAGRFAFRALAFDAEDMQVASACVAIDLPTSEPVELLLQGDDVCSAAAPVAGRDAGAFTDDAGGDGAVMDSAGSSRIELAATEFLSGEPISVHFVEVPRAGAPFVGIYAAGSTKPIVRFDIPFKKGEQVTTSSHEFAGLHAGTYEVRLVYKKNQARSQVAIVIVDDSDGDGASNPIDGCPYDGKKLAPGPCGCGKQEIDTDGDGAPDCVDGCPTDGLKSAPGTCGCGFLESLGDQDGDGRLDCYDACPTNSAKFEPLQCGCGIADTDSDSDGTANCRDRCENDPQKADPGKCGCGVVDHDTDVDGTLDCKEMCPLDRSKLAPGICGCGVADTDTDLDGTANCKDACPSDRGKLAPGVCGCGTSDADGDKDGLPNCKDACASDPSKTSPGQCGCGSPDTDLDLDGTLDCFEGCPLDRLKLEPLQCGCGKTETDTDGDGTLDCLDACASDPNKTSAGLCGCGTPETDSDGDGAPDCLDRCAADPTKTVPGSCGCGAREPFDTAGYRDAKDAKCSDWKNLDCTQAEEKRKYTFAQEESILANCSKSCGTCPK